MVRLNLYRGLTAAAHRIITQAIITGGRVFGRAFGEAYRHAQQSSAYQRAQAKAGGTAAGIGGAGSMTTQEACQILNVKEPSPTPEDLEEVHSRFKRLFDANDPEKGGSFYLQSKILRARERLEADLRPKMEQAELDAEVKAGWKPNLYKEKPKEPPKLMRTPVQLVFWTFHLAVTVSSLRQYIVEISDVKAIGQVKESISGDASCYQDAQLHFRHTYNSAIFPGFSLDIDNSGADGYGDYTHCLSAIDGVAKVWQPRPYVPASQVRDDAVPVGSEPRPPVDGSILHGLTGVKKLQDANVTGRGITVAVLDTGLDYLHPALGGGLGKGFKVRFGVDLVGDDFQVGLPARSKPDPYAECTEHGTHVSGIVAGNQSSLGFVGVAPEVNLEHYRVAGCQKAPIQSDVIIQAVLMAHSREVDVISLSLTLDSGPYADDALSEVLTRITHEGQILIVVASGNYGWQGPFSARAPASAAEVLTVGSVNAMYSVESRPRASFSVQSQTTHASQSSDFAWSPAIPGRFPSSLPLQATTLDMSVTNDDACSSFGSDEHFSNLSVVLVRRGGCSFDVKMRSLVARGARYFLIYDDDDDGDDDKPLFRIDNNLQGIAAAGFITVQVGRDLMSALAQGSNVTVNMDPDSRNMPYIRVQGNSRPPGQISGQGSWGPTGLGYSLTSILAPGQGIWSTFPRTWGGYGTLSGTSMAAPYIAGCAALVMQVYPGSKNVEVMGLLTSTARPLRFNDGTNKTYDFLAPVALQGNGVVDVLGAVNTETAFSSSHLAWNDTEFFAGSISFFIQNKGAEAADYSFSHEPAVTVLALGADSQTVTPWTRDNSSTLASEEFLASSLVKTHANITVSPQSLRIEPGQSALVQVTADIDALRELKPRCPLYSGFIFVDDGRNKSHHSISYAGIGCSMRDMPVMPRGWNQTFVTAATTRQARGVSYDAVPISPSAEFRLQGRQTPVQYENSSTLLPTLKVELAMYSRAISVHVLPAAASGEDQGVAVFSRNQTVQPGGFGRLSNSFIGWSGLLENGSWAAEGLYKFRVCAFRAWEQTQDPNARKDCIVTDPFGIRY
ncbi:hypothetical protein PpBr36_08743 [Pyricularia pennisetigena]|uniref:hypothetical protein n=1 Tax=Pyricularia pennisetigena TaxID=1578925 RepID=UPI00114F53B5|nr:hypothetical protein PpBr36_08743 [Pyricularia pennisetigena]TLS23942.1 hypothetical protein PpBr36_08743 [Pyricularia pennisetigena]